MTVRSTQKAAGQLLSACKSALRTLLDGTPSESQRVFLLEELAAAVNAAEATPAGQIQLVVTPITASAIFIRIEEEDLYAFMDRAKRETQQRVYFDLDMDIKMLVKLREVLSLAQTGGATVRAFGRVIEQLDREVLCKSPLEMLAEHGV